MRALGLLVTLALAAMGCVPAPLDLSNRRCPCAAGWTCDTARDRCVQGPVPDTGVPADGGHDAFVPGVDAFMPGVDAFVSDSGIDAFVTPIDSGTDAFVAPDTGRDAGSDGGMLGSSGCATTFAGAIVCDGFETDPGPWTSRSESFGIVVADGLQAVRGNRGLHAHTTADGGHAAREAEGLGPYTNGDLWVRISAFIPASASVDDYTWLSIGEVMPPYHGISLGMGGDVVGSYSSISATYVSSSATLTFPRDTWVCLELHVVVSDTAGAIEIYREGALAASHTGIDTLPDSAFTRFAVGIDYSDPLQHATETWLDEVVLSRTRFACP